MEPSEPPERRLSQAEVEAQFRAFSGADWDRARNIARMRAAGLVGWTGEKLLAETLVKLQSGERVWRPGVHPLVTLKVAMRSIASNIRKSDSRSPIDSGVELVSEKASDEDYRRHRTVQDRDDNTPEKLAEQASQLRYIESLVADDEDVHLVLTAWAEGLRGKAAADELGFDMKRYEAARKRLMTRLKPIVVERKAG